MGASGNLRYLISQFHGVIKFQSMSSSDCCIVIIEKQAMTTLMGKQLN
jgi:hypothetical protein